MKNTEDKCLTCGKELIQVPNKRKKLYCNTTCKSKSWYKGNKDKAKAWRDARKEDKADEKMKGIAYIEGPLPPTENGSEIHQTHTFKAPKEKTKKTTFKTGFVLPQSKKVEINDLNTQSKGTTQDLNEKKTTNRTINTRQPFKSDAIKKKLGL